MVGADTKRVEAWVALSDLFCDTEPEYYALARALKGNTLENLKNIFFEEVAPICGPNLMTPIPPVWSGFSEQQLVDDITEMLDQKDRSSTAHAFHAAKSLFMRFWFRSLWRETEEKLKYYWARSAPQRRQLASLAWEAVMREEKVFQTFFPGAANRSANPFTPFPDRMLSYFTRCVALGMDHQEHPEELASLFEEARLDTAEAMGVRHQPHANEFLKTLGAAVAAAGCLLARECPVWPDTIAPLSRQIAPGPSPDKDEAEDVYTFECYLVGLDADSPETDDWYVLATLLRLISGLGDTGTAAARDEAEMQTHELATEARARIRGALGTSEEKIRLKTELALWEFVPQASRTQLALALYYKSLNLLEMY